jgi:Zn-dependent protease with chaperone function
VRRKADPVAALRRVYILLIGAAFVVLSLALGLLTGRSAWVHPVYLLGLLGLAAAFALGLAAFQAADARRNAGAFLQKRLSVKPLDFRQEHHRRLEDFFRRPRPASAGFAVNLYVILSPAVDALAFVDQDGKASLAVTEGLLLALKPEEVEAVAAFEVAWLEKGEASSRLFLCGLADFYERVGATFLPERLGVDGLESRLAASLRPRLSRFLDPEAVHAADVSAARTLPDPLALARAIFRVRNAAPSGESLPRAYAPLFFSGDFSEGGGRGTAAGWKLHDPSPTSRIRRIAEIAGADPVRTLRDIQGQGGS